MWEVFTFTKKKFTFRRMNCTIILEFLYIFTKRKVLLSDYPNLAIAFLIENLLKDIVSDLK
jgi:hypothetical protein